MRGRRVLLAVAAVALLLPAPALASGTTSFSPSGTAWWPDDPPAPADGFHIRFPVVVTNGNPYPVSNGVVSATIDVGSKLIAAGWTSSPGGDRDLLKAFHLDPDSLRVVAMTAGWVPKAVDPSLDGSDPRRYEAPSLHYEGADSDDYTHPNVTVVWRVPDTLAPGDRANYVVYLDSDATNAKKQPASYAGSFAGADVDGLLWASPGVDLFGFVRPPAGQAGTIQVIGTQANTHVHVLTALLDSSGQVQAFHPQGLPEQGGSDSFTLGAQESKVISVSSGSPVGVRLVADRPVVAEAASTGFVPSLDGGMAGKSFVFALRHPKEWEQDTVSIVKAGPADTAVRIDRLDRADPSFPRTVTLPNAPPYRYSTGWRAEIVQSGTSCSANHAEGLPAGGVYKATVVRGERVLLQLQPTDGLFQVPTLQGATSGQDFWAAPDWTDDQAGAGGCRVAARSGSWFASAVGPSSAVAVTNPESPIQLDPRGDAQGVPFPGPRPIDGGAALSGPYRIGMGDRAVEFSASDPLRLFAGNYPAQVGTQGFASYPFDLPAFGSTGIPVIQGPLGGGDGGRSLTGAGAAVVFAPFDGTVLQDLAITRQRSDDRVAGVAMSAGSGYAIQSDPSDPVRAFTLRSSLPVVVYPTAASGGFFAGMPPALTAAVGPAQYRGYLLGLSSPSGQDPVIESGTPGVAIRYPLQVKNFGLDPDGHGVADDVQLSLQTADLPEGWQADLDVTGAIHLEGGQSRAFTLTVRAPPGTPPGATATVFVHATSLGNALVQDDLRADAFIKQSFGVGLWFGQQDGPKQAIGRVVSGVAKFDLFLKNTGSVPDVIAVAPDLTEPGWGARILRNGAEVQEVALQPGQGVALVLSVTAPPQAQQGLADFTVTASSRSAPSVQDVVSGTAELVPPSALQLVADDLVRFVDPGQLATFNLTLSDASGAQIFTALQGAEGTGWGAPAILLHGTPLPSPATLAQPTALQVAVRAPENATAGSSLTLRVSARTEEANALEAILFVRVRAVHRLDVTTPSLPLLVPVLGENVTVDLRLVDRGNLDELLALGPGALPPGWSLAGASDVLVPRGGAQAVHLNLSAPAGTPPGVYDLGLRLTSRDGNETVVPLSAQVGSVSAPSSASPAGLQVQPGEVARVEVPVSNKGNVPVTVSAAAKPGDAWVLQPSPAVTLAPGQNATLVLHWVVPRQAADGTSSHPVLLTFLRAGATDPQVETVAQAFDVGRPDLSLANATAVASPGGTLVRAEVRNGGERTAHGFSVVLAVDGQAVDRRTIGDLPAHGSAQVSFLQVRPGNATLLADANDTIVELDESNNGAAVPAAQARSAPLPGVEAVLALAAVALALHRRRPR